MSPLPYCSVCGHEDKDCLQDVETGKWTCPRCDGRIPPLTPAETEAMEHGQPTKVEWFTIEDSAGRLRVIDAKTKREYDGLNRKQRRRFEANRLKNYPILPAHLRPAFSKKRKYKQEITQNDCPTCGKHKLTLWGNTEKGIPFVTCPECGVQEMPSALVVGIQPEKKE